MMGEGLPSWHVTPQGAKVKKEAPDWGSQDGSEPARGVVPNTEDSGPLIPAKAELPEAQQLGAAKCEPSPGPSADLEVSLGASATSSTSPRYRRAPGSARPA